MGRVHEPETSPLLAATPSHRAINEEPPVPSEMIRAAPPPVPTAPEPSVSKLVTMNTLPTGMEKGPVVPSEFC